MKAHKPKTVEEFLRGTKTHKCFTCKHEKSKEFSELFTEFLEKRKTLGIVVSWERFVEEHCKPVWGYPYSYKSAQRHAEECLGLK